METPRHPARAVGRVRDGRARTGGLVRRDPGALAAQDYPNLNTLFLLAPAPAEEIASPARITSGCPLRHLREVGQPRLRRGANEVLRLVEGDNGFFLICHDDVASTSGVRILVEELYRSNAGMVGPKLTDWDDPGMLQHVGSGSTASARSIRSSSRASSTRSSTTPSATCSCCRRPACSCGPTCSAPRRVRPVDHVPRRRHRPVLARSTSPGPASSSRPRPGSAIARNSRSVGRISYHDAAGAAPDAHRRHAHRRLATARSVDRARPADAGRARRRAVHGTIRRGVASMRACSV